MYVVLAMHLHNISIFGHLKGIAHPKMKILSSFTLGWPYVPFSQDASWPGFLYCFDSKYLEMRFENIRNRVIHRSVCTRKQSQILDILGNIEILARTRPGKMARMVTLIYSPPSCSKPVWISFFCLTKKMICWRMFAYKRFLGTIHFQSIFFFFYGSQWCLKTVCYKHVTKC